MEHLAELLLSIWCMIKRHPLNYDTPRADDNGHTVRVRHCYCTAVAEKEYV